MTAAEAGRGQGRRRRRGGSGRFQGGGRASSGVGRWSASGAAITWVGIWRRAALKASTGERRASSVRSMLDIDKALAVIFDDFVRWEDAMARMLRAGHLALAVAMVASVMSACGDPSTETSATERTTRDLTSPYAGAVVTLSPNAIHVGGGLVGEAGSWSAVPTVGTYTLNGELQQLRSVSAPKGRAWYFLQVAPNGSGDVAFAAACPLPLAEEFGCSGSQPLYRLDLREQVAQPLETANGPLEAHNGVFAAVSDRRLAVRAEGGTLPGVYPVSQFSVLDGSGQARPESYSSSSNVLWWCESVDGRVIRAEPVLAKDGAYPVGFRVGVDPTDAQRSIEVPVPADTLSGRIVCAPSGTVVTIAVGTAVAVSSVTPDGQAGSEYRYNQASSPQLDSAMVTNTGDVLLGIRSGRSDFVAGILVGSKDGTVQGLGSESSVQRVAGMIAVPVATATRVGNAIGVLDAAPNADIQQVPIPILKVDG